VAYVRKGNKLPSLDLIRAYQNAIKNFCEDPNQKEFRLLGSGLKKVVLCE